MRSYWRQLVIGKDLVGDQRQVVSGTKLSKSIQLPWLDIRTGRVIRTYHDNGTRPRIDRRGQRFEVDKPSVVVAQRILAAAHGLQRSEVLEQRIGRPRRENFVAGIAQQFEQPGVGFAAACRQYYALAIYAIEFGDLRARLGQSVGQRIVNQRLRRRQAREYGGGRIDNPGARRIGLGEVL